MMQQSMTVSEVAGVLRLTPRTIRNMIVRGEISGAVKVGKHYIIPREEISRMMTPQTAQTELTHQRRQCVREILDLMAGVGTGSGRQRAMELRQKDRERFEATGRRRM